MRRRPECMQLARVKSIVLVILEEVAHLASISIRSNGRSCNRILFERGMVNLALTDKFMLSVDRNYGLSAYSGWIIFSV